jgi:hypothetical protein
MQEYKVTLKNEKSRLYNRLTVNAIILNAVILICSCFSSEANRQNIMIAGIGIAVIIVFLFLFQYLQKNFTKLKIAYALIFGLLMLIWILLHKYPPAFAQLVFGIFSVAAIRKFIVQFYTDRIIYPSFPSRVMQWNEINNIILKDGLLTIDFKNNKLLQKEIIENNSPINEKEFNDFCNQQLSKSRRLTTDD